MEAIIAEEKRRKAITVVAAYEWALDFPGTLEIASALHLGDEIRRMNDEQTERNVFEEQAKTLAGAISKTSYEIEKQLVEILGDAEAKKISYIRNAGHFSKCSTKRVDVANITISGWLAEALLAQKSAERER